MHSVANLRQRRKDSDMNALRIAAIALILGGVLALAYGGFSYTDERTAMKLGPVELKVEEKKNVSIPMWAGIAAIVAGGLVLLAGGRRK
jgi:uncharacterized membrane protein YidH (DUF202 family)